MAEHCTAEQTALTKITRPRNNSDRAERVDLERIQVKVAYSALNWIKSKHLWNFRHKINVQMEIFQEVNDDRIS